MVSVVKRIRYGSFLDTNGSHPSYRFAKGGTARLIEGEARGEAPHDAPHEPALNDRQKWIVAEYLAGRRPGHKDIQEANGCSRATAARDIRMLKRLGLIRRLGGQVSPQ